MFAWRWVGKNGGGRSQAGGGRNPRDTVARQLSRGEENKMKAQGLSEEARAGSLAGPQKGAGGVQSDYNGRSEGGRKKRKKEGIEMQDLSSPYFTSSLECVGIICQNTGPPDTHCILQLRPLTGDTGPVERNISTETLSS